MIFSVFKTNFPIVVDSKQSCENLAVQLSSHEIFGTFFSKLLNSAPVVCSVHTPKF